MELFKALRMIIVMYYTSYGFIYGVIFHLLRYTAFSLDVIQAGWYLVSIVKVKWTAIVWNLLYVLLLQKRRKVVAQAEFRESRPIDSHLRTLMNFTVTSPVSWSVWVKFGVRDSTYSCKNALKVALLLWTYLKSFTRVPRKGMQCWRTPWYNLYDVSAICNAFAIVMLVGAHCNRWWGTVWNIAYLGTVLFWIITQRVLVISHRRFGITW